MSDVIPSLGALRAFEAVARTGSVKAAAQLLNVTPGAVSQLVKTLEDRLGTALVRRQGRGLALTEAGRTYQEPVHAALAQLAEATRRVADGGHSGRLTLSTMPSFVQRWLLPRLPDWAAAHPDIDLDIRTSKALVDFSRDEVDVAIRHGLGRYPGLRSERLFAVELVPVASPALLRARGIRKALSGSDLLELDAVADWPLLHDGQRQDWRLWLLAHGVSGAPAAALKGTAFDDPVLLLHAALAGQGAALLPEPLIHAELAGGQLVRLAHREWPGAFAFYLVYPPGAQERPKVAAFRRWLLEQVQAMDDGLAAAPRPARVRSPRVAKRAAKA